MAMELPGPSELKSLATILKRLLQETHSVNLKHGHCLEIISKLYGLKDWNTASALAEEEDTDGDEGNST